MVDRRDKYIPLEHRVTRALMETCDAHETCGGCFPCGRRYEAVMRAFAYELDLISRHDAIVETVVRDRITESKRAERYRLAWLSAKQGRRRWYELYLAALNFPSRLNDMSFVRAAHRNAGAVRRLSLENAELKAELDDIRLAFSEMEGAQTRIQLRDFPTVKACRGTIHCANWGFCRRCAPDIAEEASRRYRESGGMWTGSAGEAYAKILDGLAREIRGGIDAQDPEAP